MKSHLILLNFIFLFYLISPVYVYAINSEDSGDMKIVADELSFDKKKETIQARGNVKIVYGTTTLKTDSMLYDKSDGSVTTPGSFVINDDLGVIKGDLLDYNFQNNAGSFLNGEIFIKEDNYYIKGDKIEQRGKKEFFIKRGYFTTCEADNPSWTIGASNVDIEIGEYVFSDHAVMYIKNVPVLYFPRLAFPVKTSRQTGLLSPRVGQSNKYGFTYNQPFFWSISRNKDATFTLNYEGSRGTGGDMEYRYVRSKKSSGNLVYRYIDEKKQGGRKRWAATVKHKEYFENNVTGSVDLNLVSDPDFFLDYDNDVSTYSRQKLESRISLLKNWQYSSFLLEFWHFKNLVVDEETTLQRLPVATFIRQRQRLYETPLFLRVESTLNNFWRKDTDVTSGLFSGQRLDVYPTLSLPLNPQNIFELTPKLSLRETVYYTGEKEDQWDSRYMYDFKIDFLMPVSSVYDISLGGVNRIKHIVEPGVSYTYVPEKDQSKLPSYDSIDRIEKAKNIRFKLNSYIITKRSSGENDVYHRLMELNIFRDYNLIEAERVPTSSTDKRKPWGLMTGQLRITGEKGLKLNSEVRYDTYAGETSYFSADVEEKIYDIGSFKFSYRRTVTPKVSYLDSTVKISPFGFLKLAYTSRYSREEDLFLESKYGILIKHQCWDITLSYSERKIPRENKIFITLNLRGLGEIGKRSDFFKDLR